MFLTALVDRIGLYSEFLGYLVCRLFAFQNQLDDLYPSLGVVVDFCLYFTFGGYEMNIAAKDIEPKAIS